MALLDILNTEADSSGIVELPTGVNGTVQDLNQDYASYNITELVLVGGGGGGGESAYTFQG